MQTIDGAYAGLSHAWLANTLEAKLHGWALSAPTKTLSTQRVLNK